MPLLLLGGAAVLASGKLFNTKQAVGRLQYRNPRIKFKKVTVSGIYLDVVMDITNASSADIPIEYFTGNILYNGVALSSFTFDNSKTQASSIKARSTAAVPFTVVISNYNAVSQLTKIYKAINGGVKVSTQLGVDATMYAAGLDVPVKFVYDFKANSIAGIGAAGRVNKYIHIYYLQKNYGYGWEDLTGEDTYKEIRKRKKEYEDNEGGYYRIIKRREINPDFKTNSIAGIGTVKASLEFGSNTEMEKYFAARRNNKKLIFSKN